VNRIPLPRGFAGIGMLVAFNTAAQALRRLFGSCCARRRKGFLPTISAFKAEIGKAPDQQAVKTHIRRSREIPFARQFAPQNASVASVKDEWRSCLLHAPFCKGLPAIQ